MFITWDVPNDNVLRGCSTNCVKARLIGPIYISIDGDVERKLVNVRLDSVVCSKQCHMYLFEFLEEREERGMQILGQSLAEVRITEENVGPRCARPKYVVDQSPLSTEAVPSAFWVFIPLYILGNQEVGSNPP